MRERLTAPDDSPRASIGLTSSKLGIAILILLWVAIFAKHNENRALDVADAKRSLQNFSSLIEENTLRSIGELDITLRYLRNVIASTAEPKDYQSLVSNARTIGGILVQIAIIDKNGQMVASSAMPQLANKLDLSDREHFQFHLNNHADTLFISKPMIGRASGKLSVQITRPILDVDGAFGGVVVASLNPDHFNRVFEQVDLGDGATYALIGVDGVVRTVGGQSPAEFEIGKAVDQSQVADYISGRSGAAYWAVEAGQHAMDLVVTRKIAGQPLLARARIPEATVYASSTHSLHYMVLVGTVLSILTWLAARWGGQYEMAQNHKAQQLAQSHATLSESNEKLIVVNDKLLLSEAEARRQHYLFKGVFSSAPDGMIFTDNSRLIVDANDALLQTFGYTIDELRGRPTRCLYKEEVDWNVVGDRVNKPGSGTFYINGIGKSGNEFPCRVTVAELRDDTATVIGRVGIVRDVTVERRRENALRQKQRLEALGRLTGGIAHDFNNLLTVISANVQLASWAAHDEKVIGLLAEAEKAVQKGATLNQHLVTFARQRTLHVNAVCLNELVAAMLPMLQLSVGERISLSTSFAQTAPVHVDVTETENALLNLATNARDAMAEHGGSLSLATSIETIDADTAAVVDANSGTYVRLQVTDTGIGMPPEIVASAIDPFFTTKEVGKGLGLGLTSVEGFIRQSGGFISIDSEVGVGTTVNIYLPRSEHHVARKLIAKAANPVMASSEKVILVVEDNPDVRKAVREQLAHLGYQAIEAASGEAALTILNARNDIDLIFSDVVMPGAITGPELCRQAALAWPHIPSLLTSGFPNRIDTAATTTTPMLRKPYTLVQLAEAIGEALAGAARSGNVDISS